MKLLKICLISLLAASSFVCPLTWANLPFYPIQLPRDNAAHHEKAPYPVRNMLEWWYYNGRLVTTDGHQFGYYFVIFRAQQYHWGMKFVYPLVQYQLTDIDQKKVVAYGSRYFPQRHSHYATQQLDITLGKNFKLHQTTQAYVLSGDIAQPQQPKLAFDWQLQPLRKPFLIGGTGLIPMGAQTNSYYYSITRLATRGRLTVGNHTYQLDPQKSLSWMDHQWGDFSLSGANRWIWMSMQLDNHTDISLVTAVDPKTQKIVGGIANILLSNGKTLYTKDFTVTPQATSAKNQYPLIYQVKIKSLKLLITLTALAPDQHRNGYWEGISKVKALYQGKTITGYGFTENTSLTGAQPPSQKWIDVLLLH